MKDRSAIKHWREGLSAMNFVKFSHYASIFLPAVFLVAAVLLAKSGVNAMKRSSDAADQRTYEGYYQSAYDYAEAQNHVANYGVINISAVTEVSRLEVLRVSDTAFVVKDADDESKITSWLEVHGLGVFTVDLAVSEFITDDIRQYVLVTVPKPVLTQCTITEETGEQFWKNDELFHGDVRQGVIVSQEQLKEGRILLEDSMKQNRRFYDAAKAAAERMIEDLIRQWNPDKPDLRVEVEFVE